MGNLLLKLIFTDLVVILCLLVALKDAIPDTPLQKIIYSVLNILFEVSLVAMPVLALILIWTI